MTYEADLKRLYKRRANLIAGIMESYHPPPENQRGKLTRLGLDQLQRIYNLRKHDPHRKEPKP